MLLYVCLSLREGSRPAPEAIASATRTGVLALAVLLFAQMVLGGLVSSQFAGMACPQWPACNWSGPMTA